MSTSVDSQSFGAICAVLAVAGLVVASMMWQFSRGSGMLEEWAAESGYRIVDSQYRMLARGPFFWTTSKGQSVYRITVADAQGRTRSGYARCGSFFLGLWSDKVEVRWDDE